MKMFSEIFIILFHTWRPIVSVLFLCISRNFIKTVNVVTEHPKNTFFKEISFHA